MNLAQIGIIASQGGNSFSPVDLNNLWSWWKSDAGVVLSGSNVTSWADQSGNSNLLTVKATYKAAVLQSNILNGFPVLTSNTSGGNPTTYLTALNFPDCTSSGLTVFVVGSNGTNNDSAGAFIAPDPSATSLDAPYIARFGGNPITCVGEYDGANSQLTLQQSTFYSLRLLGNNTDIILTANNSVSDTNPKTIFPPMNSIPLEVFSNVGGNNVNNKRIAEIIIYTRPLNTTEINQVESYLNTKYNLY